MPDPGIQESIDSKYNKISPSKETITSFSISDDIIFTKELNQLLCNQIQDLTVENQDLKRTLEEETKLRSKSEHCNAVQSTISFEKSAEVAGAKIVELSKKCRERAAEVEVLRTKCKSLEDKLAKKEAELDQERQELSRLKSDSSTESQHSRQNCRTKEDEDQVRYLSEKLQQTQTKLYDTKNTCASLKQDLNKAQKLLCSEVGENVSISSLISQPGGWRGRAEQIRLLQQKLTELQAKLSDYEGTSKTSLGSIDRKNLASLRNVEKERRQLLENSARELRQAEVALENSKRKLEASKARIKILEHELTVLKGHVTVLNDKRSHDDSLIQTLNHRLKMIEARYQEREVEVKNREEKWERDCLNLKNDLQSAQLQIDNLRRRLEEREIEIEKLREGIVPENNLLRIQKVSLPEIRQELHRPSPPNSCRSSREPNEYVTLALAAEAERERLLELVAILNQRVEKERGELDMTSESLRNEKSRCAKLELKLRKLETERVGMAKVDSGYYRGRFLQKSLKANAELISSEDARLKLELLEEECLALKARLDTVQQDKAADLVMYRRMLDQTKKIFQDACRSKPPGTAGSRSIITI